MERDRRMDAAGKRAEGGNRRSCSPEQLACLIRRIQVGDTAAAHELHAQLEPMLLSATAPYREDAEVYENLRGELYIAVDRLARQFDETRGVNPFTYFQRTLRPAVRTAVDRERRPAARELSFNSLADSAEDGEPEDDDAWERAANERAGLGLQAAFEEAVIVRLTLQRLLSRLTERERDVIALWEDGYDSAEMAESLGIPAANCRQTLRRALARLRRELQKELE